MICLSPAVDKNPTFDLEVSFLMDNMKITPDNNILMVVNDPIYYPFEDSMQKINSNNIIQIEV